MAKILISDFDYTLLNENDLEKNIAAVKQFVEQGNIFVIATGRRIKNLLKMFTNYSIPYHYLICNDGGMIFDQNLNLIYKKNIPVHLVKKLTDMLNNTKEIDEWYIDTGLQITTDYKNEVNGIIIRIKDYDKASQLLQEIQNKFPEIHGYLSENWINLTEKTVSKGMGIKILNNILNFESNDIYTIGNDINDLSMSVYNSYCMSNSIPQLKKICKDEYGSVYLLIQDIIKGKI